MVLSSNFHVCFHLCGVSEIGIFHLLETNHVHYKFAVTRKVGSDSGFSRGHGVEFWVRGFVGSWFSRGSNVSFFKHPL